MTFGESLILFLLGGMAYVLHEGMKEIVQVLKHYLVHPKSAQMQFYAITKYLDSTEGRQSSADEQRVEIKKIIGVIRRDS